MDKNVIGIDFGTTKTLVSYYDKRKQKPVTLRLGRGTDAMPTSIFISENEIFYGEDAEDEAASDYDRYIKNFKLKLGVDGSFRDIDGKEYSAIKLTSLFLKNLKKKCEEEYFLGQKIFKAVITKPVSFSPSQENDLKKAAENAGFAEVELLDEPESAGRAFLSENHIESFNDNALIVDWGGGTVDVALLYKNDRGEIVANPEYYADDNSMGGVIFDEKLWSYAESKLKKKTSKSINDEPLMHLYANLKRIKDTKESFSRKEVHKLHLVGTNIKIYNTEISRSEFNACINPEVDAFMAKLEKLVNRIPENLKPKSIILIGGSCNILLIQEKLKSKFKLPCIKWHRSNEAVALGASCEKGITIQEQAAPKVKQERTAPKAKQDEPRTRNDTNNNNNTQENAAGLYKLAINYNKTKNYEIAFDFFKQSAALGNAGAQFYLGSYYENGIGVSKDEKKALEWYAEADKQGYKDAKAPLNVLKEKLDSVQDSVNILSFDTCKKLAEQGDANAQYQLGLSYELGLGVRPNAKEAFKWYKESALRENSEAQYKVAPYYFYGFCGVYKNIDNAFNWAKKSAVQGNKKGEYLLGLFYLEKEIPSIVEANKWLTKSANKGYSPAINKLKQLRNQPIAANNMNKQEGSFSNTNDVKKNNKELDEDELAIVVIATIAGVIFGFCIGGVLGMIFFGIICFFSSCLLAPSIKDFFK